LQLGGLKNRLQRLLGGGGNKGAGVNQDKIGSLRIANLTQTGSLHQGAHTVTIGFVLSAAQSNKSYCASIILTSKDRLAPINQNCQGCCLTVIGVL
jgi:hypothetical protein